jgi:hypothetical protein
MPVIDVTVNSNGETRIETHGFVGEDCQRATRSLEVALGLVRSEQCTADFYQHAAEETRLTSWPNFSE